MARATAQGANALYGSFQQPTMFSKIVSYGLPLEYQKFFKEWCSDPSPVHFIPKQGKFERNELTGEVQPVQNVPLPLKYPPQINDGIWGGEAVIKGFQKRESTRRRVPHFWVPVLKKTVVHSEILGRYMTVTVTARTLDLVHEHHGFDYYILKTKASDLRSLLALVIKRTMLEELKAGCPSHRDDPEKQKELLDKYLQYADPYTPAEIEWYGLSVSQARRKLREEQEAAIQIVPLKHEFRATLIQQLKDSGIAKAEHVISQDGKTIVSDATTNKKSWMSKINPFGKK